MEDQLYREIILEHWKHPQNYGVIIDATIDISDNNPLCGDEIRITAVVSDKEIKDIKFTAQGCVISKASASIFSEKIKGMSFDEMRKITPKEVLEELGVTLTPSRTKCALLVYTAARKGFAKLLG